MIESFSTKPKPHSINPIHMIYHGIDVYLYGITHGITGGASQEYISFVNNSIAEAKGKLYCEKSMKVMYKGLDYDLCDWAQVPFKDAVSIALTCFYNPHCAYSIFSTIIREKLTKKSTFGDDDLFLMQDLISDPRLHLIPISERRSLMGFPSSEHYFKLNKLRRDGKVSKNIVFASRDWQWLSHIESLVNIPYRSVHMIEFAVAHAQKNGFNEISLFIGESHNSDIEWYVTSKQNNSLPGWILDEAEVIKIKAHELVGSQLKRTLGHLAFLLAAALSVEIPIIIGYLAFFN